MELIKMKTAHRHEDDIMRVLYEASYKGCASTLNSLMRKDPLVLYKINSRTVFTETPLHISSSLGHLEFTKALLIHKPQLALELDSFGSTALHVASAEGHVDIVKELLVAYDQACLITDQEGRIPIHYAVIKGRIEVVRELVRAKPECLSNVDVKGKTILHLCVTYNRLDILKALVELDIDNTSELLNLRDLDGKNTILHLAIMLKQVETVRYLLSIPKIREGSNLKNDMGFTAQDILEQTPTDLKSLEMQVMIMNVDGIKMEEKGMDTLPQPPPPSKTDVVDEEGMRHAKKKRTRQIFETIGKFLEHEGNWLEEMRGNLSLVATVISTITFQVVLSPPGSLIQQGIGGDGRSPFDCLSTPAECPGQAMMAVLYPDGFLYFIICNTISFVSSLSVVLLLVSGVPLKNKVMIWTLSAGMCITVTSLAFAYLIGISLIVSDYLWDPKTKVNRISISIWIGVLGLVGLYFTMRFVMWLLKTYVKIKKHYSSPSRNGSGCCVI